ncbi:Lactonase, 7-bladed beta-propeller [compost metagenome]|jgi:DNA-binding beta-propeller fold protein YncE|uniref:YncE family protein n=1 Tax=Variovorax boronicumulans TaxID=436515 RepID=UPI000F907B47|nr:YncE family protein [Variovorax boronicumulans]PBI83167.1 Lactonase, 7-bladed beta-propeller [Variovorax boronicumulans]
MINARTSLVRVALAVASTAVLNACVSAPAAQEAASYFLSVQDGRAGLADGKPVVRDAADTLAVIELSAGRLRVAQQIALPTSLVGPPSSIAIAPGGRLALVSAATRRDPTDAAKVVAFDLVSAVTLDLGGRVPPRVVSALHTGAGASGISINRAGTLALVANRVEGSISVLGVDGESVQVVGKLALGDKSGPAHVAFTPDGRRALVTRDGDSRISLLAIEGRSVTIERELYAGLRPYGLDVSPDGAWAVVTNLGAGQGDVDTISLIDLSAQPPRVVDTVSAGQTPEGVFFSPDGRAVGVTVIDGSNKPKASAFHGPARYRLFGIDGGKLRPEGQLAGGQWLQGHAFSPDGRAVLVQDAANRQIRLYRIDGNTVSDSGQRVQLDAAPATLKFWR